MKVIATLTLAATIMLGSIVSGYAFWPGWPVTTGPIAPTMEEIIEKGDIFIVLDCYKAVILQMLRLFYLIAADATT